MTPNELQSAVQIAGAVLTGAGSLWGVVRLVRPRIAPYLRAIAALDTLPVQLAAIEHELKPNGGGSMRDEVRRIGRDVRINTATVRAYVDNSSEGMFETDAAGAWTHTNETLRRWCDRSRSDLFGQGWLSCIAPHDRDTVRDEWTAAMADRRELRMRMAMIDIGGNEFTVDVLARTIVDMTSGEVTGWVGHIRRRHESGIHRAVHVDDGQ